MTGDGVTTRRLSRGGRRYRHGSGCDVAIEAADMVLLDSFSSIVEAVKFGHDVFDNLK